MTLLLSNFSRAVLVCVLLSACDTPGGSSTCTSAGSEGASLMSKAGRESEPRVGAPESVVGRRPDGAPAPHAVNVASSGGCSVREDPGSASDVEHRAGLAGLLLVAAALLLRRPGVVA